MQNTYVDYRNLGDQGTDTAASIQPPLDGQPGSMINFGRPTENLRSRTEIARDVLDDLLYYRDRTYRYLIDIPGGTLTWEVGGAGRVNNTAGMAIRPFLTPRTNRKGTLAVGTVSVNLVTYTVDPTAYATEGLNAVTLEHRSVPGTVVPLVTCTAGPIYRILVVFDSANPAHTAVVVAGLVNAALVGIPALTGKLTAVPSGVASAIDVLAETSIDVRSHGVGTDGQATADVEAHTLVGGALGTFTTTNPLAEGDLLAIRYDYVIEPSGGVAGGRAESNEARGNADVSANLFIAQDRPEWLPGAIPICKVVGGNLHWLDGTVLAPNTSGSPGTSLGSYVDGTVFSGLPTGIVNGGIETSVTTVQGALVSVDQRLSQHRAKTYVVTDGTNSTGGAFNSAAGFRDAISALNATGGTIVLRRGNYAPGFTTVTGGTITVEGETCERAVTYPSTPLLVSQSASFTINAHVHLKNLAFTRTNASRVTLARDVLLENCTWSSGVFTTGNEAGRYVDIRNCTMFASNIAADNPAGLVINGERVFVENSVFNGPDAGAPAAPVVLQGSNVVSAVYNNCSFVNTLSNTTSAFAFASTGNTEGTTFVGCTFRTIGIGAFTLDIPSTYVGGDITFYGCTFENAGHACVIRANPSNGRVRFVNCKFRATGSFGASGTSFQQMVVAAPAPAANLLAMAHVSFENCEAFANPVSFASMSRALIELGAENTATGLGTPVFGRVTVNGFAVNLIGATTQLPPTTIMVCVGRSVAVSAGSPPYAENRYENISINANDKVLPTALTNVWLRPAYLLHIHGITAARPVYVDNVRLSGVQAPFTDGVVGGVLYVDNAVVDGVLVRASDAPGTNRYGAPQYDIRAAAVYNLRPDLFNSSSADGCIKVQDRGSLNGALLNAVQVNNANFAGSLVCLEGATARRVDADNLVMSAGNGTLFRFIANALWANDVIDCTMFVSSANQAILAASATAGLRSRITGNRIATTLAAGNFIDLLSAAPAGANVSNNVFITSGAPSANCQPPLNVPVDTLALVTALNTYSTAGTAPR